MALRRKRFWLSTCLGLGLGLGVGVGVGVRRGDGSGVRDGVRQGFWLSTLELSAIFSVLIVFFHV